SDGATGIVYTPTQRALTIDMSKIAGGTARAWWFDPATGVATLIGDSPASGTKVFTPPTAQDWVLVIDNATLNLPAPGS
ncbi:MAG TPA: putative collagen-binding domain-containing protein, partial [Burkholderiaceae bacterium]|nr:putative collagen-binding domain-containing protein [Burkholderiaceae bacterium]